MQIFSEGIPEPKVYNHKSTVGAENYWYTTHNLSQNAHNKWIRFYSVKKEWVWKSDQISADVIYVGRVIPSFYRTYSLFCNTSKHASDALLKMFTNGIKKPNPGKKPCIANECWITLHSTIQTASSDWWFGFKRWLVIHDCLTIYCTSQNMCARFALIYPGCFFLHILQDYFTRVRRNLTAPQC